nr:hypothetical protein [Tanacetum cinerariifolium]
MDNGGRIRIRNNSQQVGDVTEVGSNLSNNAQDNETDEPGPQDIYFKVMGNNSNETAKMYGLGVCASDVWGVVLSCSARRRDKFQWKSTAGQLSVELAQYKVKELQRQGSILNDSNCTNAPSTSPKSLVVAIESQPLRVGLQVYLKSISISEIVAKGRTRVWIEMRFLDNAPNMFSIRIHHGGKFQRFLDNAPNMFSIRIHHGGKFQRYPGRMYVSGHVDIFDMLDIDLFTVIALNMMVLKLGYTDVPNLVSNDVLEKEDVVVINADGFDSDLMMIVRIKSLHEVTVVKLMLMVYKLLLLLQIYCC